jgi:hypothetical protein
MVAHGIDTITAGTPDSLRRVTVAMFLEYQARQWKHRSISHHTAVESQKALNAICTDRVNRSRRGGMPVGKPLA